MQIRASTVLPGIQFTRLAAAIARTRNLYQAATDAENSWRGSPAISAAIKGTIEIGTTESGNWGEPLHAFGIAQDLIEAVRGRSVLGRMAASMRVALFDTLVPRETSGATSGWVAPGAPILVSRSILDRITMVRTLFATIVVASSEVLRLATPQAELSLRNSIVAGVAEGLDSTFLSADAAVASLSPAGIRYGAAQIAQTGISASAIVADLTSMIDAITTGLVAPYWIMRPRTWAKVQGTLGDAVTGPDSRLLGIPVISSTNIPLVSGSPASTDSYVLLVDAASILLADEGRVDVDTANATSLQLVSNPVDGAANMTSLYQTNSTAIRVRREINWQALSGAVAFMQTSL